jgi:hypothetical protein
VETNDVLLDPDNRPMFVCAICGRALTRDDIFELGLRLPEPGETWEEYGEADLIDAIEHVVCAESRAGR